jgi:hypothetical protein
MTIRLAAGGLAGLVCGAALAQPPAVPQPASPILPVGQAASQPPTQSWSADVSPGGRPADGLTALPKALAESRAAASGLRDYTAGLVRQERVRGVLLPEQTGGLTVRTRPLSVAVVLSAPKAVAGTSTSYVADRGTKPVRHRSAGPDGVVPAQMLTKDDPAPLSVARHPVTGYGFAAVLDRVEAVLKAQAVGRRPVQVLVADFRFDGKPVTRFEVFADGGPAGQPRRLVLCLDAASKLPVRFEAYGPATPDAPGGEVLEVVSFVNVRLNPGVGDTAFGR